MGLEAVFKLSIYTLTGFVGLILGLAENGPIPYFSLPITLFAYWWCETPQAERRLHSRGLNEPTARVLGILALIAAAFEFFGNNPEGKLLAGIHLVVYLTWVVLLQQKSIYRYWLLMSLGMMHVAVGSVLTLATWYGLSLIVYLFGGIWTLSIFSLYRVAQEFSAVDPLHTAMGTGEAGALDPGTTSTARIYNSVRFDNQTRWISMRLVSGVTATALAGLVVGMTFFMLIPRIWVGTSLGLSEESLPPALRRSVTGQMNEIRLGDMGPILESNDPVLRIRLKNHQTQEPLDVQLVSEWLGLREPLFRGAVMTEYDNGRWRPERGWGTPIRIPADPANIDPAVPLIRQEIHLERLGNGVLPCIGRPLSMHDHEGYRCALILEVAGLAVRRPYFEQIAGPVDYVAYSELPSEARRARPGHTPGLNESTMTRVSRYLARCTGVPDSAAPLRDLSREIVEKESRRRGEELSDLDKARALESYLRDSGLFKYSLQPAAATPLTDPVVEFVMNRREGHCQYFASALGLMLRSAGIPARLVTGFKGGEALDDGALSVEKRFAHVWVEAWIDGSRWVTFDATPEQERDQSVSEIGNKRNFLTSLISRISGVWETNILEVSLERQESTIYQPLREIGESTVQSAREFWNSPRSSLLRILAFLADPRNWLTLPGLLTLGCLGGFLWVIRRRSLSMWKWKRRGSKSADAGISRVEFYERFAALMQSQGRTRHEAQTQREFVTEAVQILEPRLSEATAEEVGQLAQLYYRVRFGSAELTSQESRGLSDLFVRLERDLAREPRTRMPV